MHWPTRSPLPPEVVAGESSAPAATRRSAGTSWSLVTRERRSTSRSTRPRELPEAVDGLPVLTLLDLGGRRVHTIVDRLEARDYTDLQALAGIIGRRTCIEAALSMDPGVRVNDVADAFTLVTSILDERFPAGADEAAAVKRYFANWADELGAT